MRRRQPRRGRLLRRRLPAGASRRSVSRRRAADRRGPLHHPGLRRRRRVRPRGSAGSRLRLALRGARQHAPDPRRRRRREGPAGLDLAAWRGDGLRRSDRRDRVCALPVRRHGDGRSARRPGRRIVRRARVLGRYAGGFRYRNRTGEPAGATALRLRQSRHGGRTAIRLDAAGDLLDLPDLASLESPVTVQLRRSGGAACWSARYSIPTTRKAIVRRLREKSDPPPCAHDHHDDAGSGIDQHVHDHDRPGCDDDEHRPQRHRRGHRARYGRRTGTRRGRVRRPTATPRSTPSTPPTTRDGWCSRISRSECPRPSPPRISTIVRAR